MKKITNKQIKDLKDSIVKDIFILSRKCRYTMSGKHYWIRFRNKTQCKFCTMKKDY